MTLVAPGILATAEFANPTQLYSRSEDEISEVFPTTGLTASKTLIYNNASEEKVIGTLPTRQTVSIIARAGIRKPTFDENGQIQFDSPKYDVYQVKIDSQEGFMRGSDLVVFPGKKLVDFRPQGEILTNYSGAYYDVPSGSFGRAYAFWFLDSKKNAMHLPGTSPRCLDYSVSPSSAALFWNNTIIDIQSKNVWALDPWYAQATWIDEEHLVVRGNQDPSAFWIDRQNRKVIPLLDMASFAEGGDACVPGDWGQVSLDRRAKKLTIEVRGVARSKEVHMACQLPLPAVTSDPQKVCQTISEKNIYPDR